MPQPLTGHVFISYSRRDDVVMRRIVKYLRVQGIKAWVDNERLVPGTPVWENEIEKAIKEAFAIVVVLSPDAKNSEWVLREITLADQYNKRAFPVLVGGKNEDSIPFRLITRQFVDIRKDEPVGLQSLSTAISFYLEELTRLEEKRIVAEREAERIKQEHEITERTAREAKEKAEIEKKAKKDEAERIAKQKAEKDRIAKVKLKQERLAKEDTESEQKAREETERTAKQNAENETEQIAKQKAEEDRIANAKLEQSRLAKEKADEEFIFKSRLEDEFIAKERDETNQEISTPKWSSVFWILLGFALGSALGGLFVGPNPLIIGPIGWVIGGAVLAFTLRNNYYILNWKNILWITVGWGIGGAISVIIVNVTRALPSRGTVTDFLISNTIGWTIAVTIGWAIGGAVLAFTLRNNHFILNWKNIFWVTAGWAIGGAISGAIIGFTSYGGLQLYVIELPVVYTIGGTIGGAIGGAIMIYQIKKSTENTPEITNSRPKMFAILWARITTLPRIYWIIVIIGGIINFFIFSGDVVETLGRTLIILVAMLIAREVIDYLATTQPDLILKVKKGVKNFLSKLNNEIK